MVGNSESGSEPKAKIIMITDKKANLLLLLTSQFPLYRVVRIMFYTAPLINFELTFRRYTEWSM